MAASRRNLCRRRYEELSDQFFAEVDEICLRHRYRKEDVDRSMKRLLKIAEFRDPTPNDVSTSTSLANITKEHLEYFFTIFRSLVERPVEADTMSQSPSDDEDISINDVLPSPSDSDSSSDSEKCNNTEKACPSPSPSDVSSEILDEISSETEEEQFEVERIISRTVNAEGKYVYHIKWVGYETSSDPENFVDEDDMHCPELIKEFEQMEQLKKKQRAKKLEEQAMLAKKRKLEAEQRAKAAFASTSRRNSTKERHRKKSCKEINLCSSSNSSEEEDSQSKDRCRADKKCVTPSRSPDRHSAKKKIKHKASATLKKRIESTSSSSEEDAEVTSVRKAYSESHYGTIDEKCTGDNGECEGNIDPDDAFKYVMRESDGFRKGYKAVKVSVVCKHPITRKLVAVVVFVDPSDGHEFAQYIPLRETHANAPTELRQYFVAASGCTDPKKLVLHLLLQLPNKAP